MLSVFDRAPVYACGRECLSSDDVLGCDGSLNLPFAYWTMSAYGREELLVVMTNAKGAVELTMTRR